jgi:hypothetical protein
VSFRRSIPSDLKVNLRQPLPPGASVPERIGEVPVRVEVVGRIVKRG